MNTSSEVDVSETLDVKGASCPMPVVRTRQAVDDLAGGDVLEVVATDSGSVSDIAGWAGSSSDVELLQQTEETVDGTDVFRHYIRKL